MNWSRAGRGTAWGFNKSPRRGCTGVNCTTVQPLVVVVIRTGFIRWFARHHQSTWRDYVFTFLCVMYFWKYFNVKKWKNKLKIKLERVIPRRDAQGWRRAHRRAAHRTGHRRRRRLRRLNSCGIIDRRQRRPPGWVKIFECVKLK